MFVFYLLLKCSFEHTILARPFVGEIVQSQVKVRPYVLGTSGNAFLSHCLALRPRPECGTK